MQYFAYGSNLDKKQMKDLCPDCKPLYPATLPNYRLIFAGYSRAWKGGVATIRRVTGQKVHGGIYEITDRDLARLDKYEGHPATYNRIKVIVFDDDGKAVEAVTYMMIGSIEETLPSKEYAMVIEKGLREWGII